MGSGSSRLGDSRPKTTNLKRRLSSFICGSSSSRATAEIEDYPAELLVNSAGYGNSVPHNAQATRKDSALRSIEEIQYSSPKSEEESLSDRTSIAQSNIESVSKGKHSIDCNESVLAHCLSKESRSSQPGTSSTSSSGGQTLTDTDCSMNTETFDGVLSSVRLPQQELGGMFSNRDNIEGHSDVQTEVVDSSSAVAPAVSRSITGSRSLENDSALTLDLGFLVSNRIQGSTEGNILHIDITSSREARRNSRAFSSHNPRRHADVPPFLFATDDDDIIAYRQGLLLGFGSNNLNDGMSDDLWHLGRRSRFADERRPHSRSEFWGRLRGGTAGQRGGRIVCRSGLHPNGSCLCGLGDESTAQNSMSRILMLAEALFEVLDELHQQPTSFGLSVFSNPAPESIVDSLPVKSFEKSTAVESDGMDQCYICLEEYETGDKIRVLPCTHEYHMTCVDKWLKEIHGVCPLCRGEVRQVSTEASLLNSNGSSMAADLV